MIFKVIKASVITAGALGITGGAIFGRDIVSYVSSAARSVQDSVKDSVPMEFQIRRAHDLLNDVIPEMHADIRAIAQQEVEIDSLRQDIDQSRQSIADQTAQLSKLHDALNTTDTSFTFGQITYTRDQVKDDLENNLEMVREAQVVLAGKERLLDNRQRALAAAEQALEHARLQKSVLESQVASLEGQYKLLQASSVGSTFSVDDSKLAQTQRLLDDIKKQLDVSEHVLAHESHFADPIPTTGASEQEVMHEADEFFASAKK